jgi:hypothetical protein
MLLLRVVRSCASVWVKSAGLATYAAQSLCGETQGTWGFWGKDENLRVP